MRKCCQNMRFLCRAVSPLVHYTVQMPLLIRFFLCALHKPVGALCGQCLCFGTKIAGWEIFERSCAIAWGSEATP